MKQKNEVLLAYDMENKVIIFLFEKENQAMRLDSFLTEKLAGYSRSAVQKLIQQGCVAVNYRCAFKSGHELKPGDEVEVTLSQSSFDHLKPHDLNLEIIDEQSDFLVINKRAGLLVHHAASNTDEFSLVNGILHIIGRPRESFFGDDIRPGIVHRLDKNTSGIILVAKNRQAQEELSNLFKQRRMYKTYLAIVHGHPSQEGKVDYPIGRHQVSRHKMAVKGSAPRPALTYYVVQKYYENVSLIQCMPVTGRTHQIRVHCAAIGHPIVGDSTYGGPLSSFMERQALHAHMLSFTYKGVEYRYTAPLPEDFLSVIQSLEKGVDVLLK